jgi:RNA polymerase sigma factor (sigma-70 family)
MKGSAARGHSDCEMQQALSPAAVERPRSTEATEEVSREHAGLVSRWARALGGPGIDAEEVVQEVFVVVHARLPGFRGDSKLTTWLYGITANVVRRKRQRERWCRWLGGSANEVAGHLAAEAEGGADSLERQEARAKVYAVLDQMPEKYRNALILFEIEERSAAEIAELTGAREGTVWVWLHRARADFLKRLEKLENEGGL